VFRSEKYYGSFDVSGRGGGGDDNGDVDMMIATRDRNPL